MIIWSLLFHLIMGYPLYELLAILIAAIMLWFLTREQGKRAKTGARMSNTSAGRKP